MQILQFEQKHRAAPQLKDEWQTVRLFNPPAPPS